MVRRVPSHTWLVRHPAMSRYKPTARPAVSPLRHAPWGPETRITCTGMAFVERLQAQRKTSRYYAWGFERASGQRCHYWQEGRHDDNHDRDVWRIADVSCCWPSMNIADIPEEK